MQRSLNNQIIKLLIFWFFDFFYFLLCLTSSKVIKKLTKGPKILIIQTPPLNIKHCQLLPINAAKKSASKTIIARFSTPKWSNIFHFRPLMKQILLFYKIGLMFGSKNCLIAEDNHHNLLTRSFDCKMFKKKFQTHNFLIQENKLGLSCANLS